MGIAIITGVYILIKLSINNSLKLQFLSSISLKLIFWTFVGARATAVLINFRTYFYDFGLDSIPRIFFIWDNELSLFGGAIAFFIYFYFACKKEEQNFWRWLDVIVPAGIIALAIGHMGAFFGGINYGSPTSLPWGVNFASPLVKYTVPIHPTQIYAFVYSSIIAISLMTLFSSPKFKAEENTGLMGIGGIGAYSVFRFIEEFLRGDDTILILGIRSPKIIIFLFIIFTGAIFYLRYNKIHKRSAIFKQRKK